MNALHSCRSSRSGRSGFCKACEELLAELIDVFGLLPSQPPGDNLAALWCVAGMISVADWIGSNEPFFPSYSGLTLEQSRKAAERALTQIHWHSGGVRNASFGELLDGKAPQPLQSAFHPESEAPRLLIAEGPMGWR